MKTIGIIGGMGPLATVDLMQKIILSTRAATDQEHIHILVDNNTAIPDRSAAICGQGPSPVPQLIESADRLVAQGADVLLMGCNTAHYFLPELEPYLKRPLLNMIEATARWCRAKGIGCAGLLATVGTYQSGIYQQAFKKFGVRLVLPMKAEQEIVQSLIYEGVKAGRTEYDVKPFRAVTGTMKAQGAEVFVLGCTELPLALRMYQIQENCIDATQILAEAAIEYVGASRQLLPELSQASALMTG